MNQINYKKSIKKQLLSMAMLMAMSLSASAQQLLPYQNTNLSVEARANDLLSRLTLEEKMKLMRLNLLLVYFGMIHSVTMKWNHLSS